MKIGYVALPAAAAVIFTLAGCSSGPSSAAACRDFSTWRAAQHGGYGADLSELASAAAAAPPGQLYTVLNQLDVYAAAAATNPEAAAETETDVQIVQGACSRSNHG